ncbi:hypothetical protein [Pollutimonas bauzanensis]|jgi:hypothetical protein|uniref:hypothetical protein n=1 Tax=Pollutimonas bauzanensis TaxID=658167 RepID=UPI00333E2325
MPHSTPTICAACAEVATLPGNIAPHKYMRIQGQRPSLSADGGYDTQYRCLECDTVWVCHTDKWGFTCGFKLVPTAE